MEESRRDNKQPSYYVWYYVLQHVALGSDPTEHGFLRAVLQYPVNCCTSGQLVAFESRSVIESTLSRSSLSSTGHGVICSRELW